MPAFLQAALDKRHFQGNRDRLAPLLTAHVQSAVEAEKFLAHSIFVGERPIGLCYADRGLERWAIAAEEFSAFRRYCGLLAERLATLFKPTARGASGPG